MSVLWPRGCSPAEAPCQSSFLLEPAGRLETETDRCQGSILGCRASRRPSE